MCRAAVIRYAYYFLSLIVYFSTYISSYFVVPAQYLPIHLPLAPHELTEVKRNTLLAILISTNHWRRKVGIRIDWENWSEMGIGQIIRESNREDALTKRRR